MQISITDKYFTGQKSNNNGCVAIAGTRFALKCSTWNISKALSGDIRMFHVEHPDKMAGKRENVLRGTSEDL